MRSNQNAIFQVSKREHYFVDMKCSQADSRCTILFKKWLFLAKLDLHCCVWAFSSSGEWGLLFIVGVQASHHSGFSCCGAQALDAQASVVAAGELNSLTHVESSWSRDRILAPCTSRWILCHWATREIQVVLFLMRATTPLLPPFLDWHWTQEDPEMI